MFNAAVIDECSQALEIACWLALIQSPKAVLAGDHLQLPPTIMSENAARKGLAFTLMERVISKTKEVDNQLQEDTGTKHLRFCDNITCKPLSKYCRQGIHPNKLLPEIFL